MPRRAVTRTSRPSRFATAQYMIQEDRSAEKRALQERAKAAYDRVCSLSAGLVARIEIPFQDDLAFDGESFPGLLHLPDTAGRHPCVIFIPGTDMTKEDLPNPEDNVFAKRGLACLSIDGPGQGESLVRNLKVTNVLLTLARILSTLANDRFSAKDEAAEWVIEHLSHHQWPALKKARDVYLGAVEDDWGAMQQAAATEGDRLVGEIGRPIEPS